MSSMTSYLQAKLGDHSIGKASFTMPVGVFLALFTGNPGEAGSLTSEVSGGSYARQALTASMGAFDTTTGISTNSTAITFPAPTAGWGTVTYVGICDASTSGNLLYYEALSAARTINNGDVAPQFPAGSITITQS